MMALQLLAYSIKEAALISSIERTYLFELIKTGKLRTTKVGRRTLVRTYSLRQLLGVENDTG